MVNLNFWERYKKYFYHNPQLGFGLDISKMNFSDDFLENMQEKMDQAYIFMEQLESGAIANPDEKRMVGHYWLRHPDLAPDKITREIKETVNNIKDFSSKIHSGEISSEENKIFKNLLVIGIGGSSLGPKFVSDALGTNNDKMNLYFLDNTDPDGIDRVLEKLYPVLDETLVIVISKSGGTIETRNGMLEVQHAYTAQGLEFSKHVVSITQPDSKLDNIAKKEKWLATFPLWDWVGGRTSVTSPVGLLPLALQGINIEEFLDGARLGDALTRKKETLANPAALLTLMWYYKTQGQGGKQMVILPYKDRLELFSKYLQQLIMESLGKEKDLAGKVVHQGIAVYGNKGSADQHSYLQQLLDGPNNFFAIFIEVLKDRKDKSTQVEEKVTSGDYLNAFLLGTRKALAEKGKDSITITIEKIDAKSIGLLIAIFERTVGFYATLININAYHQPAVEAGKKAARKAIELQRKVLDFLEKNKGQGFTVAEIAAGIEENKEIETVFKIAEHLAANIDHGVQKNVAEDIFQTEYYIG